MTTELSVYHKMSDPMQAMVQFGNAIAKSGIFNCGTPEAGQVLAMECMHRGISPLALAERYHIIFGKLSMKADAMLAEFNARGGKHKVVAHTAERAAIQLSKDGETQTFELTWEDAKKEPFVYNGKEEVVVDLLLAGRPPKIKPKYATPRSRMQMMWARVVSEGVAVMDPGVKVGKYTPEEIEDFDEVQEQVNRSENGHVKSTTVFESVVPSPPADTATPVDSAQQTQPTETEAEVVVERTSGQATGEQVNRIKNYYVDLEIPLVAQQRTLENRGITSLFQLSFADAEEIITKLSKLKLDRMATTTTTQAVVDAPAPHATSESIDSPASIERLQVAQNGIKELEQTMPGIAAKVVGHLKACGLKSWQEITVASCEALIRYIQLKQMDEFFRLSLEKAVQPQPQPQTIGDQPGTEVSGPN